jgi:hypothetical protein
MLNNFSCSQTEAIKRIEKLLIELREMRWFFHAIFIPVFLNHHWKYYFSSIIWFHACIFFKLFLLQGCRRLSFQLRLDKQTWPLSNISIYYRSNFLFNSL